MKATEINFFRGFLLSEKTNILNKTAEFKNEQRDRSDKPTEDGEVAATDASLNLSLHLHERDRNQLLEIEKALGRIDEGTYGQCASCGSDIDSRRLKARPFTVFCIDCMEDMEDARTPLH